jgi:ferric-dicitrate binding protein FerR (iron transport regulator)
MNQEMQFSDAELEQAMAGIRNEQVDDAVVEAAASRVWVKLAAARDGAFIGNCSEFQSLIPDFKAGRLDESKVLLLRDHLHECVACRRVYEGRPAASFAPVTAMPQRAPRTAFRWAVAAAVVASAGATIWLTMDHTGTSGRAVVQAVNGTLFEVTAQGITPLLAGQDLPDGVEVRSAKDSGAVLKLRDGSVVEMRERSGFSTEQSAGDLTIRLLRGSVIVQAAKRNAGHLYVSTADCRVAVTGTIFGVSAGAKGSRVSVIQGEVHVERNNQDSVLHPGGQMVTSPDLDPEPVSEDVAWSRDHERYDSLLKQLAELRSQLKQVAPPGMRYSSNLLPRLPAATALYISIPNLSAYLGEAQDVLDKKLAESPTLRQWWAQNGGRSVEGSRRISGR